MNRRATAGHVCALLTNIIWGSTFVSAKVLLKDFNPIEILFFRFLIGYIFLWILCPKALHIKNIKLELQFAAAGVTGICLNYLFENMALLYTGAAIVSVIVSASPFMVGILAYLFLKQKLKRYFTIGFVIAIIGITMICFAGEASVELHWLGQLISLGACLMWAVYGLLSEGINQQGFPEILVTRRLFFYGLISVTPLYLLFGDMTSISKLKVPVNLGNLFYLGLGACVMAFIMWNFSIRVLGTVTANVYVYLLPVVTIVVSALFLQERITLSMVIGTVLTLTGVALSEWDAPRRKDTG